MSDAQQPAEAPILEIENLRTYFHTDDGIVKAVDGISMTAFPGTCIVGESGSGSRSPPTP